MNMKNIFKLSAMILAAAFVAGCSQNDELDVTPVENEGQLTIHATASDFVSSDADTRIINEGADTQFEAGDKIGIFAIRSTDNKLLVQNMPELTGRVMIIKYIIIRIRLMWLILLMMKN